MAKFKGRAILVGNPNVGKSAVFNRLTGGKATVSNYPGTTVESMKGILKGVPGHFEVEVLDTPGMYSMASLSEEERVAAKEVIEAEAGSVIVQVGDANNLERTLALTLQLLETPFRAILVLNMVDEAETSGVNIDAEQLSRELGIPVVMTSAVTGRGITELRDRILEALFVGEKSCRGSCGACTRRGCSRARLLQVGPAHEGDGQLELTDRAFKALTRVFEPRARGMARLYAWMFLEGGRAALSGLIDEAAVGEAEAVLTSCVGDRRDRISFAAATVRHGIARRMAAAATRRPDARKSSRRWDLDRVLMHPLLGLIPLALVAYVGLYLFVGRVGAGLLVDFLDQTVFEEFLGPRVSSATAVLPEFLRDLIQGEYGLFTVGIRYAIAIIMPIVGTFFLAFSVLEDSGYLPRMAFLLDRWFRRMGLNGRAVIPMVLGFGCDTMATVVTRTLETARERLIATLLLALAIPCSAQLGVIIGVLSSRPTALAFWAGTVLAVLIVVGTILGRILPGQQPIFYMEMPPLRRPFARNAVTKSLTRMAWYVSEVIPVFLGTSFILTLANRAGLLHAIAHVFGPAMALMGLPNEAGTVFIYGFFRRDYGAAGLYKLVEDGMLSTNQTLVASVVLTLFVPCIAQFTVMVKERGLGSSLAIVGTVVACAMSAGVILNRMLEFLGVVL